MKNSKERVRARFIVETEWELHEGETVESLKSDIRKHPEDFLSLIDGVFKKVTVEFDD